MTNDEGPVPGVDWAEVARWRLESEIARTVEEDVGAGRGVAGEDELVRRIVAAHAGDPELRGLGQQTIYHDDAVRLASKLRRAVLSGDLWLEFPVIPGSAPEEGHDG